MSQEQPQFNPSVLVENREYLRNLARSLVFDEHRADDLVQQACLALLERPPKRSGSLRSWMARVVQNLAYSMLARESERSWREKLAAGAASSEALDQSEERMFDEQQLLLNAVRKLRQPYRSAIFLRYYKDLSPTQIAAQEQISLATVKTRLRRGLELLRAELDSSHAEQRGSWCLALLPMAAPLGAIQFAGASGAAAYLKGILIMKKPTVAVVSALALAGVASLTWVALEGRGAEVQESERSKPAKQEEQATAGEVDVAGALNPVGQAPQQALAVDRSEVLGTDSVVPRKTESNYRVSGRVVDESGRPVSAADVRLYGAEDSLGLGFSAFSSAPGQAPGRGGVSTTSDAQGRFSLALDDTGSMNLAVGADRFAPFRREIMIQDESSFDAGDLQLDQGALLSGRVVDSAGRGVPGASIESLGPKSGPQVLFFGDFGSSALAATSDASGYFSIKRHAVGPWRLRASSSDHPAAEQSGQTSRGGELAGDIRIALADGYEISGSVLGLPDQVPDGLVVVANGIGAGEAGLVLVNGGAIGGHRVALQENGEFRIKGLGAGQDYRLVLMLGDRVFGGKRRSESRIAASGERGVRLAYRTPAALLFQVVDAHSGEPVERFDLSNGMFALRSDAAEFSALDLNRLHPEGRMRLEDFQNEDMLGGQERQLTIKSVGYEDYTLGKLSLTAGQEVDLGLIRLVPVPVVRLTVRDAQSGAPVVGALVRMSLEEEARAPEAGVRRMSFSMDRNAGSDAVAYSDDADAQGSRGVTDEDGVCVLTSMPGKSVRLRVSNAEHAPYASDLMRLASDADVEHEVRLEEGSTVRIQVLDTYGVPQAGMAVQHRAPHESDSLDPRDMLAEGEGHAERTDSDGMLYFENLASGMHSFALKEDPFASNFSFSGMRMSGGRPSAGGLKWKQLLVEPGAELSLTLEASPRGSLAGVVSEAGSTLAGARVRLLPKQSDGPRGGFGFPGMGGSGPSALTDSKGRYALDSVPVEAYRLEITHPSRQMPSILNVSLREGSNELDVALSVAIIEGRVTDPAGKPLPGLKVTVKEGADENEGGPRRMRMVAVMVDGNGSSMSISDGEEAQPVSTDAQGYYQLRGVASGKPLVVEASGSDYAAVQSESVELREGETLGGVNLQLRAAGTAELVVLRADGSPAGGYLVSAVYRGSIRPAPEPKTSFVGPDGKGILSGLLVGNWEVSLRSMGGPGADADALDPLPREVEIKAGETELLDFEVE